MAHIIISDAAQRYIDDRINADHIATRAIALSITTFCGVPHVYTGNVAETRIFIKRDENVDEAIANAFGIEDEQDTTEEQEDIMSNETKTETKTIATDFSIGAEIFIDDNTDENGNATRNMELYLAGSADRVSVFTVRVNDDAELLTIPRGGNVEAYINFAVDSLFVTHDVDD